MHPDETRIFFAILTAIFVLGSLMGFCILSAIHYQKNKVALQQERIGLEINALEQERSRIAVDLHDDLGASLSAIKMQLHCVEPFDDRQAVFLKKTEGNIDELMQKLRRISFNMMPHILQRNGLHEAVNELTETIAHSCGIKIVCECNADTADEGKRIHIYRIIQEILNNILKHAQASVIDISVKRTGNMLQLHIADNGVGFDKNAAINKAAGRGLQNIMARVELLKAQIYLAAEPGKGVDYLIEIFDNNDNFQNKSNNS